MSIIAFRELLEESGEDKGKTRVGRRRRRETTGSLPCPLSVTFLVNSSYDSTPLLSFRWEEGRESRDGFKHLNKPPFYFCQFPFLQQESQVQQTQMSMSNQPGILTSSAPQSSSFDVKDEKLQKKDTQDSAHDEL